MDPRTLGVGVGGVEAIQSLLPNRYPFLMIDRVLEASPQRVRALKNVTVNEEFFVGHFPGRPVMPAALLIEGMAQTAGVLMRQGEGGDTGTGMGYLVGVDEARFRRQVVPGDQVIYEATLIRRRRGFCRARVCALVAGERVAEGLLSLASAPEPEPES